MTNISRNMIVSSLLSFLTFCILFVNCQLGQLDKIKLTEVQTITLYKENWTTGRRSSRIPQLKCVGNYYKCQMYAPNVVQCYNRGYDGFDTQWECKADLDKKVKFGIMKVSCEGYEFPNDPYILVGSCGLEYSLESVKTKNYYEYYNKDLYETNKLSNFLTLLIMIIVIIAVYKSCNKNRENNLRRDINNTFGANVVEVNDPNYYSTAAATAAFPPPPPPYGFVTIPEAGSHPVLPSIPSVASPTNSSVPPPPAGFKPINTSSTTSANSNDSREYSANVNAPQAPAQNNSSGWSSFLTGAAVGGVTGFLLSRRNTNPSFQTSNDWPSTSRTESPPPSYEENSMNNVSSGFASTTRR